MFRVYLLLSLVALVFGRQSPQDEDNTLTLTTEGLFPKFKAIQTGDSIYVSNIDSDVTCINGLEVPQGSTIELDYTESGVFLVGPCDDDNEENPQPSPSASSVPNPPMPGSEEASVPVGRKGKGKGKGQDLKGKGKGKGKKNSPFSEEEFGPSELPESEFPEADDFNNGTPDEDMPLSGTPAEDMPLSGTPDEDMPLSGTPAEDMPLSGSPAEDMPQPDSGSFQDGPAKDMGRPPRPDQVGKHKGPVRPQPANPRPSPSALAPRPSQSVASQTVASNPEFPDGQNAAQNGQMYGAYDVKRRRQDPAVVESDQTGQDATYYAIIQVTDDTPTVSCSADPGSSLFLAKVGQSSTKPARPTTSVTSNNLFKVAAGVVGMVALVAAVAVTKSRRSGERTPLI